MKFEYITADTILPPCMPLPTSVLRIPVRDIAKAMYACMLDAVLTDGTQDANGILFIRFPIAELSAVFSCSAMTVKRSLKELEEAGLILRVRQGIGKTNKIYVLIPKTEDNCNE